MLLILYIFNKARLVNSFIGKLGFPTYNYSNKNYYVLIHQNWIFIETEK